MAKKAGEKRSRKKNIKNKKAKYSGVQNKKRWRKAFPRICIALGFILVSVAIISFGLEINLVNLILNDDIPSAEGLPPNTPRLTVDRDKIDYGVVKHNTRKTFSFKITNSGNDILKFEKYPSIEVVRGC